MVDRRWPPSRCRRCGSMHREQGGRGDTYFCYRELDHVPFRAECDGSALKYIYDLDYRSQIDHRLHSFVPVADGNFSKTCEEEYLRHTGNGLPK